MRQLRAALAAALPATVVAGARLLDDGHFAASAEAAAAHGKLELADLERIAQARVPPPRTLAAALAQRRADEALAGASSSECFGAPTERAAAACAAAAAWLPAVGLARVAALAAPACDAVDAAVDAACAKAAADGGREVRRCGAQAASLAAAMAARHRLPARLAKCRTKQRRPYQSDGR